MCQKKFRNTPHFSLPSNKDWLAAKQCQEFVCTKSLCSVSENRMVYMVFRVWQGFGRGNFHTDGRVHVLTIRCPHMDFCAGKSLETCHALVWQKTKDWLTAKQCQSLFVLSLRTGVYMVSSSEFWPSFDGFGRVTSHWWVWSCFDYLCDRDGSMLHILEITGTLKIKIFILFIIYIYLLFPVILFIYYLQYESCIRKISF